MSAEKFIDIPRSGLLLLLPCSGWLHLRTGRLAFQWVPSNSLCLGQIVIDSVFWWNIPALRSIRCHSACIPDGDTFNARRWKKISLRQVNKGTYSVSWRYRVERPQLSFEYLEKEQTGLAAIFQLLKTLSINGYLFIHELFVCINFFCIRETIFGLFPAKTFVLIMWISAGQVACGRRQSKMVAKGQTDYLLSNTSGLITVDLRNCPLILTVRGLKRKNIDLEALDEIFLWKYIQAVLELWSSFHSSLRAWVDWS